MKEYKVHRAKKYPGFRMTTIHAIIAIDDGDEEGIPAQMSETGCWMPLIAANEERLDLIVEAAQTIADQIGKNFKIARFSVREDIGEIRSRKLP